MKVNDKEISDFGATFLSVDFGYSNVITYKDWLRGSLLPQFYAQEEQYTTAIIKIVVEAANIGELEKNCSNAVAAFKGKNTELNFDNMDFALVGSLVSATDTRINAKAREIEITFEGIKYSLNEVKTFVNSNLTTFNMNYSGNCSVYPTIVLLLNAGDSITLTDSKQNQYSVNHTFVDGDKLVIDGNSGLVTLNNENIMGDYDAWEFPSIDSDIDSLTISAAVKVESYVTYRERWI